MNMSNIVMSLFLKVNIIGLFIIILKISSNILRRYFTSNVIYKLWRTIVIFSILPIVMLLNNTFFRISKVDKVVNSVILNTPHKVNKVFYENQISSLSIETIIFYIWICGVVLIILFNIVSYNKFINNIKRWKKPIDNVDVLEVIENERCFLNMNKKVNVYYCDVIKSPILLGILKPIILIPRKPSINKLTIRHEFIHFKRKDPLIKLLTGVVVGIYWFNPLIYILQKSINTFSELSCDELVLKNQNKDTRNEYFDLLLNTMLLNNGNSQLFISGFSSASNAKLRLTEILNKNKKSNKNLLQIVLIVLLVSISLLMGCSTNDKPNNIIDPEYNDSYEETISIEFESFEAVRNGEGDRYIEKEINGYLYKGTVVFDNASKIKGTNKWVATFKGTLYKE